MSAVGPILLTLLAGIVSFTSPCCLPLMPGYLSYVSGIGPEEADRLRQRRRVLGCATLFVLGFATVFTLLGAASGTFLGPVLLGRRQLITRIAGGFVILMGVAAAGMIRIPLLNREARFDLSRIRRGPGGAVPLGMAFAVGWTPCIGPVLAGILTGAAATQTPWRAGSLLFVYSLGLGIPFLLLAVGYNRAQGALAWFRRHARKVEIFGGALLVVMGLLMITGQWLRLFLPLIRWFSRAGWPPI